MANHGSRYRRVASLVMGLVLATGSSGCSWILTDAPPTAHQQMAYFDCSTSKVPPVVDTVIAVIYTGAAIGFATSGDSEYEQDGTVYAISTLGLAGLAAASAYYGYTTTSECRAARAAMAVRLIEGQHDQPPPAPAVPGRWQKTQKPERWKEGEAPAEEKPAAPPEPESAPADETPFDAPASDAEEAPPPPGS